MILLAKFYFWCSIVAVCAFMLLMIAFMPIILILTMIEHPNWIEITLGILVTLFFLIRVAHIFWDAFQRIRDAYKAGK